MATPIYTAAVFDVADTLVLGDPCYLSGGFQVLNAAGKWKAEIDFEDGRVSELLLTRPVGLATTFEDFEVGVDSGQVGAFCSSALPVQSDCDNGRGLRLTDGGVITSSGYGDGYYHANVGYSGDKPVAILVTFIVTGE